MKLVNRLISKLCTKPIFFSQFAEITFYIMKNNNNYQRRNIMEQFKNFLRHDWSKGTKFLLNLASFIALFSLFGGIGIALYIIGMIIMKELAK